MHGTQTEVIEMKGTFNELGLYFPVASKFSNERLKAATYLNRNRPLVLFLSLSSQETDLYQQMVELHQHHLKNRFIITLLVDTLLEFCIIHKALQKRISTSR